MGQQMRLGMVGIVQASQYVKALNAHPSDAPALVEMEHPNAPSAKFPREVNA